MLNLALIVFAIVVGLGILSSITFAVLQYIKFRAFFRSLVYHEEGKPSNLGLIVDSLAASAGRSIAVEVKTTLMGKLSGVSRGENALEGAILKDGNPGLMALLETMPSVKKLVSKNPALLGLLGNVIGGLKSNPGASGNGGRSGSQPEFKL